jgi:hypothetical protein
MMEFPMHVTRSTRPHVNVGAIAAVALAGSSPASTPTAPVRRRDDTPVYARGAEHGVEVRLARCALVGAVLDSEITRDCTAAVSDVEFDLAGPRTEVLATELVDHLGRAAFAAGLRNAAAQATTAGVPALAASLLAQASDAERS